MALQIAKARARLKTPSLRMELETNSDLAIPHEGFKKSLHTAERAPRATWATWQVTRHMVVERRARLACPPGLERFTFQQVGEAAPAHLCEEDPSKAVGLQSALWSGPRQGQSANGLGAALQVCQPWFLGSFLREPLGEMCALNPPRADSRVHPTWKDTGTRLFTSQDFSHCGAKMKPSQLL